jgi:ABC-type sugar transport system ATPase subunit
MPSTVIRSYRYDPQRRELAVVFQTRRAYTYSEVPQETYAGLKAASSKGEFFNRHIRAKFAFTREADVLPSEPGAAKRPKAGARNGTRCVLEARRAAP